MSETLEKELQDLIIKVCDVEDVDENNINPEDPLIGPDSPLMLDSLDAVEIVVAIQHKYNIRMDNQKIARKILKSIKTLADFIRSETGDKKLGRAVAS